MRELTYNECALVSGSQGEIIVGIGAVLTAAGIIGGGMVVAERTPGNLLVKLLGGAAGAAVGVTVFGIALPFISSKLVNIVRKTYQRLGIIDSGSSQPV